MLSGPAYINHCGQHQLSSLSVDQPHNSLTWHHHSYCFFCSKWSFNSDSFQLAFILFFLQISTECCLQWRFPCLPHIPSPEACTGFPQIYTCMHFLFESLIPIIIYLLSCYNLFTICKDQVHLVYWNITDFLEQSQNWTNIHSQTFVNLYLKI